MSPLDALLWVFVATVVFSVLGFFVAFALVIRQKLHQPPDLSEVIYSRLLDELGPPKKGS